MPCFDGDCELAFDDHEADLADLNNYSDKKSYAKGLVDVALLTANANQLKHALAIEDLTYKIVNLVLVISSLSLQVSWNTIWPVMTDGLAQLKSMLVQLGSL